MSRATSRAGAEEGVPAGPEERRAVQAEDVLPRHSTDRVPFRAPRRERDPRRYSYLHQCALPRVPKGPRTCRKDDARPLHGVLERWRTYLFLHCARRRPTALSSETTCIEDGEVGEAREVNGAEVPKEAVRQDVQAARSTYRPTAS
jgi:hypothetical protein